MADDRRAWRVVLVGWAVLSAAAVGFVAKFGVDGPLSDEWVLLAPLVGERPVLPWLWEPHNEHRYPLPRLVWLTLHRLTNFDFRAGAFASVAVVSAAGLGLATTARKLRGRARAADVLLPALLLHFGHWENWLIGYQLAFALAVGLAAAAVGLLATAGDPPRPGRLLAAGLAVALLGPCGAAGVVLALPLAAGVLLGAGRLAVAGRRPAAASAAVLPLVALAYATVYLATLGGGGPKPVSTAVEKLAVAGEVLAGGLGPAGRSTWPASGVLAAAAVAAATAASLCQLGRGPQRSAAVGVLAGLAGVVGVAASVGVSRAGIMPEVGFSSRYGLFAALGLGTAYLATARPVVGRATRAGEWLGLAVVLAAVAAAAPPSVEVGAVYRNNGRAVWYQARSGATTEELTGRFVNAVFAGEDTPDFRAQFSAALKLCERHRIGPYRPRRGDGPAG